MAGSEFALPGADVVAQQVPLLLAVDDVGIVGGAVGRVAVCLAEALGNPRLPLGIERDGAAARGGQVLHRLAVGEGSAAAVGFRVPACEGVAGAGEAIGGQLHGVVAVGKVHVSHCCARAAVCIVADGVGAEGDGGVGLEHHILGRHGQHAVGVGACAGSDGGILRAVACNEFQLFDGNLHTCGGVEYIIHQEANFTHHADAAAILRQRAVARDAHVDALCGCDGMEGCALAGVDGLCVVAVVDGGTASAEGRAVVTSVVGVDGDGCGCEEAARDVYRATAA